MVSRKVKKVPLLLLLYAGVVIGVVIAAFPFFWVVLSSLKPVSELVKSPPSLIPLGITIQNYKELIFNTFFVKYFVNTVYTAGFSTSLAICLGSLAAYGFTRFKFFGSKYIPLFTLFCYMLPRILLVLPLYGIMRKMNLLDSLNAIVIMNVTFSIPFGLMLLINYFKSIPIQLEEAAFIDGANRFQVLTKIVLPLAAPGVIAIFIFVFITAWNDYTYCLILISSDVKKTLSAGIMTISTSQSVLAWGPLLASATFMAIPVIMIVIFLQRYVVSGFTAGAVKE